MIEVMYAYCYVLYTCIGIYTHTFSLEKAWSNERQMVSRSHYAFPVSTTLMRRWYYVNAVPTTLVIRQYGSYYVVFRSLPPSLAAMLLLRNTFKI